MDKKLPDVKVINNWFDPPKYPDAAMPRVLRQKPPFARSSADTYFVRRESYHDLNGEFVWDASSGAGVTSFGHSAPIIKDAMIKQIMTMPYAHSAQWTSAAVQGAASAIIERAGPSFQSGGVTFYSGGSEAIEAALKFGVQLLSKHQKTTPVLSRRHSYHGNTLGALAVSDHPRCGFLDTIMFTQLYLTDDERRFDAFAPSMFTGQLDEDTLVASCTKSALDSLRHQLYKCNEDYDARAVVLIETIGGTTLGIEPPNFAYLLGVRELCDEFGAILIHDEVLSGNYRTGHLLASSYYSSGTHMSVAPDIAVLGKGITGGYFPMSAVVLSSDMRAIIDECGKIAHTSTNQNHPIGCAAVMGAMMTYDESLPQIRALSKHLMHEIVPRLREAKHVHSINGIGCLWGVRFDPDREGLHLEVKRRLSAAGIACYTDGATVEGKGNMMLLAPPFNTHGADLENLCDAIESLKL